MSKILKLDSLSYVIRFYKCGDISHQLRYRCHAACYIVEAQVVQL